jgi:hypothetical protein
MMKKEKLSKYKGVVLILLKEVGLIYRGVN